MSLDGLQTIALNRVDEATAELEAAEALAEAARKKWRARMFAASKIGVPHYRVAKRGGIGDDRYRVIRDKYGYAATADQGQHAA